jgi:hypothetical protein
MQSSINSPLTDAELYSQMCDKYYQDIEYLWTMPDSMLKEADNPPVDLREQLVLEQKIAGTVLQSGGVVYQTYQ